MFFTIFFGFWWVVLTFIAFIAGCAMTFDGYDGEETFWGVVLLLLSSASGSLLIATAVGS